MASLVADYSSSNNESDSDSPSDGSSEQTETNSYVNDNLTGNKLPLPDFGTSGGLAIAHSVFSNPFTEAERAKRAILEKHVKMTPTKDDTKMINGKKICWNFRKGRCRFGHNCKFAHDSDLHSSKTNAQENNLPFDDDAVVVNQLISSSISDAQEHNGDDEEVQKRNDKRKRPGLSQGLIPGKKVMKMYKKQSLNASLALKRSR